MLTGGKIVAAFIVFVGAIIVLTWALGAVGSSLP